MRGAYPRALAWVVAAGLSVLAVGCGSIQAIDDGGTPGGSGGALGHGGAGSSGSGGTIGTGSGGTVGTGTGGVVGTGAGGKVGAGTGGKIGTGGAVGTGGRTAGTGGAVGTGGRTAGTGGTPAGTGGRVGGADASTDVPVDAGNICLPAAARCCATASDCGQNEECAGKLCDGVGSASTAVCKVRPARATGQCWTDADCAGTGGTCVGPSICPCTVNCLVADRPGACSA